MIGFASGFALHTLRRTVVLPAFAFPMTRIRNCGHSARIASALKAPCLTGSSPNKWASMISAGVTGEVGECMVNVDSD